MLITHENVTKLYERFKKLSGLELYRREPWGYETFQRILCRSVVVYDLSYGLLRLDNYVPNFSAELHALFDSKDVLRAEQELRAIGLYTLDMLHIKRIEFKVPSHSKSMRKFLKRFPCKFEGILRNGLYDDTMVTDGDLYSIVKEDLL